MILLLDAANTIIHKPAFFEKSQKVLLKYGWDVEISELKFYHKIISEIVAFPDRTNSEFYLKFNKEWLYALGIISSNELLEELFKECTYLPWEKFEDTNALSAIKMQKAVLSNFHSGLSSLLETHFPSIFSTITISENEKLRKPDVAFYEKAIKQLGVKPSEILYVGDSIKLDLEPAIQSGMNAWIIDRTNHYPMCNKKISSFHELNKLIK